MATTSYGSPYVSGSDLVAGWPAASLTVANAIDAAGYYIGRGINAQTASYTGVLTDAGKTVTMTVATSNTFTVPLNATVAYPTGTRINILNLGAGACTVTATGGVTINGTITALAHATGWVPGISNRNSSHVTNHDKFVIRRFSNSRTRRNCGNGHKSASNCYRVFARRGQRPRRINGLCSEWRYHSSRRGC